jgi:hypothetical protein
MCTVCSGCILSVWMEYARRDTETSASVIYFKGPVTLHNRPTCGYCGVGDSINQLLPPVQNRLLITRSQPHVIYENIRPIEYNVLSIVRR